VSEIYALTIMMGRSENDGVSPAPGCCGEPPDLTIGHGRQAAQHLSPSFVNRNAGSKLQRHTHDQAAITSPTLKSFFGLSGFRFVAISARAGSCHLGINGGEIVPAAERFAAVVISAGMIEGCIGDRLSQCRFRARSSGNRPSERST